MLPCYVLAKIEAGTDREAHAVSRVGQQPAEQEHMHKLHIGAEVNVLAGVELSATAKAIEVSGVRRGRGLQYPTLKQTSHNCGGDCIMGFQINVLVNGADRGVHEEGGPLEMTPDSCGPPVKVWVVALNGTYRE